jgi:hypothetical protein
MLIELVIVLIDLLDKLLVSFYEVGEESSVEFYDYHFIAL